MRRQASMAAVIPILVDCLATFRLSRLVTTDTLTADARGRVIRWAYRHREGVPPFGEWADEVALDPDPPKLAVLATCSWCASVWCAAGVVALRRLVPRAWGPVAEVLALAAVAGLVSERAK